MNRTGDRGWLCKRPTCTKSRSNSLATIKPRWDHTALIKAPWTSYLQSTMGDMVKFLLQINKRHTYGLYMQTLLNILAPYGEWASPQYYDYYENCTVFLNLKINFWSLTISQTFLSSTLKQTFPGKLRIVSGLITMHLPILLHEKQTHQPTILIQLYRSQLPHDAAWTCRPRQPHSIQRLEVLY